MIDFDKAGCQSVSSSDRFGLHDPEGGTKAIIDETEEVIWNCTVLNPSTFDCVFTAIDANHGLKLANRTLAAYDQQNGFAIPWIATLPRSLHSPLRRAQDLGA
jgi:hypothetical protein